MVGGGELSMEIAPEKVPIAQKYMIEKANMAGKPAITVSRFGESSEVVNAVLDGSDCVMLQGHPEQEHSVQSLELLAKCCVEAEKTIDFRVNIARDKKVVDMI